MLPALLHKNPQPGTRVSPGRAPVARPGAPPGDTFLSRKGSGGSPGSPSRGHVALLEGLRWARPGAPPEDMLLTRKRKEKKRKGKSYYRRFLKITAGSILSSISREIPTTGGS